MKATQKLSVIGLGKLGACYSAFFADAGFSVVGVDINKKSVASLNAGKPPVIEPELAELISKNKKRLSATTDIQDAVRDTDTTFVIVPTPSTKQGDFSLTYILAACKEIGKALREKKKFHLVSVVSTVLPGDSTKHIIPTLEKYSGKKCGVDFGYCYNPSLIAIGDVVRNLSHPDFLFLGANDEKSARALHNLYKVRYPSMTPERMTIESVEVAKIALNSYVTMKITFANMIGQLCERIPHANAAEVTRTLGKDARIGSRYLKSGLGFGGPCFPRDNEALAQSALRYGVTLELPRVVHNANEQLPKLFAQDIAKHMKSLSLTHIGFLGVSYKPRTTLTEESHALKIAELLKKKYTLSVFEPLGIAEAKHVLKGVSFATTLKSLVNNSEAIFVSNFDPAFNDLPTLVAKSKRVKLIVDPWGMFNAQDFPDAQYHVTGT